jgi:Flp pilus assembly protein TadG
VNPVVVWHMLSRRGPMRPRREGQPAMTRCRLRDEFGASGVEFLIMAVALFLLFTTLVQYGIRFHAQRVAEAAAREGAVATARWDGTTATGRTTARVYINAGQPAVLGGKINASRSATQASVTVTVKVPSLMPWLDGPVTSQATAPVERFAQ